MVFLDQEYIKFQKSDFWKRQVLLGNFNNIVSESDSDEEFEEEEDNLLKIDQQDIYLKVEKGEGLISGLIKEKAYKDEEVNFFGREMGEKKARMHPIHQIELDIKLLTYCKNQKLYTASNLLITLEGFLEKFYLFLLLTNADNKNSVFSLIYLLIACYISIEINK